MPKLEFWYDFASTYSYLSAIRIEAMAKPAQVEIIYRPFLLGPIFKSYGWNTSPFRLFPVKGNHMVRDITRIAGDRGSAFHMPEVFPANSLQAARMALVAEEQGCIGSFTRLVFEAEFSECRDISDTAVLSGIAGKLGLDAARGSDPAIKDRLRAQTERAAALGIFGAPTFITESGELFWGDDRLAQALAWASRVTR
jgi:2-hydroxychromene-2-carboxylate isomerase